jgi:Kef-type K+ transport system membrane component KefB
MIENILLVLLVLLLFAKIGGAIFAKIGLDSSIGELITGIIFGGSVLNLIPAQSVEPFGIIGSVLILFVAGLKQQDIADIYKDKVALEMGVMLLLINSVIMTLVFFIVPTFFGIKLSVIQSIVMGVAFAIIDIGVPAKVFISKGLINHPVGKIAVRSAIVNIVLGLLTFTVVTLFLGEGIYQIAMKAAGIVIFLLLTVGLVIFLSKISKFVMRLHVEEAEFSLAVILVLALAYFTEIIGFSSVLGAFIAGVLLGRMPFAETKSFSDKIKSLSFGLFIPLFFVWFGLTINLGEIVKNIVLALIVFCAYSLLRFIVTYTIMKKYKMEMPGLVSSSMLSVDVESLVILMVASQIGIFQTDINLTLFAPSVVLSTLVVVVLVALYSKKDKIPEPAKESD